MSIFGRAYGRNITGKAFVGGREVDLSSDNNGRLPPAYAYVTEDRKSLGLILNDGHQAQRDAGQPFRASPGAASSTTARKPPFAAQYRSKLKHSLRPAILQKKRSTCRAATSKRSCSANGCFAQTAGPDPPMSRPRGIDVGAKYEIYTIINGTGRSGKGVIVISVGDAGTARHLRPASYVMNEGAFSSTKMPAHEASQEEKSWPRS